MKFLFSLPILFLTTTISVTAQNLELPTDYIRNNLNENNELPANVQGSPYPEENFQSGSINIGGKAFTSSVRYNALTDAFEIKDPSGEITTLLRRTDITVNINGRDHQIEYYFDDDGNKRQGYFQKLNDGETLLLKKQGVTKRNAVKATNSYGRDKPATLEQSEQYFLKIGDTPAEEVRLKRKDILKVINNDKVEDFVKERRFKLKNEPEVIQTLEYYNSLNSN